MPVDVRIHAGVAENFPAPIQRMERGEFLHDLYDRLAFERLHVPALVERDGDIDLLAQHFLWEFMREVPSLAGKGNQARAARALGLSYHRYRYYLNKLRG